MSALKAGDSLRKDVLRLTLSKVATAEKAGKTAVTFSDAQVEALIRTEIKVRKAQAEQYRELGKSERADRELAEATVLEEYLPKQLTDSELAEVVAEAVALAASDTNFGAVMKLAVARVSGRADGKRVSAAVKTALG
jgi:uncharacterized protein YqeY